MHIRRIFLHQLKIRALTYEFKFDQFDYNDYSSSRNIHQNQFFYSWDGIYFILREYEEMLSGVRVQREISINFIYPEEENRLIRSYSTSFKNLHQPNKFKLTYSLGNLFFF